MDNYIVVADSLWAKIWGESLSSMPGCLVVNGIVEAPVGQEIDEGLSICQGTAFVSDVLSVYWKNGVNILFEELRSELVDSEMWVSAVSA